MNVLNARQLNMDIENVIEVVNQWKCCARVNKFISLPYFYATVRAKDGNECSAIQRKYRLQSMDGDDDACARIVFTFFPPSQFIID